MKIKFRNILIFLIIIIAGLFIVFYLVPSNKKQSKQTNDNKMQAYSSKSIKQMEKLDIKDKINTNKYSKTLDIAIFSNNYVRDNISYYEAINYIDNDNLISYINTLAKNGLAITEINEIFEKFLSFNNFDINNAKRYLAYSFKNHDISNQDVVTRVNLNLDKDFYTDTKRIEDQGNIYALVNKFNYVDMDYVPKNLKPLFNISSLKMVDVAADAYEEFVKGAKQEGYTFIGTTAYRSATWQKSLYDSYVNKDGKEAADRYSARPGYSEHQLGYSVDLNDPTFTGKRLTDKDYEWIKNNCYKYGFIIRYPENGEKITGYMHENWHLRYVGKDVAAKINELNITFDEYYDLYIAKH